MKPRALLPVLLVPALALPAALAVVGTSGCKQDSLSIDSGVEGSKQGDELTPTEQEQLCEAIADYTAQVVTPAELARFLCTVQGIAFSLAGDGSVATCVTLRDGCLDAPPEDTNGGTSGGTSGGTGGPEMCDNGIDWTNCMATVAEIEACYEEYGQQTKAAFAGVTCDKMPEYKTNPPSQDPLPLGEACSRAKAKCPSVLPTE